MRSSNRNKFNTFVFIFIICFLVLSPSILLARPPSKIIMSYDTKTSVLDIEVKHVTVNVVKHYIRKVVVYKNSQEILNKTYPRQPQPPGFSEKVNVNAKVGDIFTVKAYCIEGGIGEEKLEVTDPEKK